MSDNQNAASESTSVVETVIDQDAEAVEALARELNEVCRIPVRTMKAKRFVEYAVMSDDDRNLLRAQARYVLRYFTANKPK